MDLTPDSVGGPFDVVLFLGVLYHLRDPMAVLERLRRVTSGVLVLETEVGRLLTRRAAADFFPGTELNDDPTNWWAPNVPAMLGMLRSVGFADVSGRLETTAPCARRQVGVSRCAAAPTASPRGPHTDRFVFHARAT